MRRLIVALLAVIVLIGGLLLRGSVFAAQQEAADYAGHPLVGTWLLDTDVEIPDDPPSLGSFSADGIYHEIDPDGTNLLGVWEPTGDATADVTFSAVDEQGSIVTVRASAEVTPDGQSLTATYTVDFLDPATGEWSGEIGPGMAEGTRLMVEAPGTPVASFEEAFGTPEATPAD